MNNEENKRRLDDGPRIYGFWRSIGKPSVGTQIAKLEYQECTHIYSNWKAFTESFPRKGDVMFIYDLYVFHPNIKGIQARIGFLMKLGINIQLTSPKASPLPPIKYSKAVHQAWIRARAKSDKKRTANASEANAKRKYPSLMDELRFQKIFTDYLKSIKGENVMSLKQRCLALGEVEPSYYVYLDRYIENMQNGIWKYPAEIDKNILSEILSRRIIEKGKDGIWRKFKTKN